MNLKMLKTIIAGLALSVSSLANAGLIDTYGIGSYTNGVYMGGENNTSIDQSSGSTQLFGEFSNSGYLPTLKAKTTSGYGSLLTIQAFQYTGSEPFDLALYVNLHGSASGDSSDNYINASVGLLLEEGITPFSYGDQTYRYNFPTLYFEPPGDQSTVDYSSLSIRNENDVNKTDFMSISLNTNDIFYVLTQLQVRAEGGSANAWDTLTLDFSDTSQLRSAIPSAEVPEPSTLAIFALGIMGLVSRRFTKK